MKQVSKFIAMALFVLATFSSCKKDDCPAPVDLSGNWLGKYSTVDGAAPTINQFYELNSSGQITVHDGFTTATAPDANKARGTWSLTPNGRFRATYRFLTLDLHRNIDAALGNENKKMTGTRGQNGTLTGNGNIDMDKQ